MKKFTVTRYKSDNGNIFDTKEEAMLEDLESEFSAIIDNDEYYFRRDFNTAAILYVKDLIRLIEFNPDFMKRIMNHVVR